MMSMVIMVMMLTLEVINKNFFDFHLHFPHRYIH